MHVVFSHIYVGLNTDRWGVWVFRIYAAPFCIVPSLLRVLMRPALAR